jgi:hypothetical protein
MQQTNQYTVDVPIDFAFDWLLHGTNFLSSMNLKSFQYDYLETGGRFIAYEEINEHRFVPVKGEYMKLEHPSYFKFRMWFPGGIETIEYQLKAIDRTTHVQATIHQKHYSLFHRLGNWLFKKRRAWKLHLVFELEKKALEEALFNNTLQAKPAGVQLNKEEMELKWNEFHPNNAYVSWVRPNI